MADLTGMLQAAAGAAGEENLYIEDVFSTYLYTGNGSTQTITNGIDLDGEGGLVWIKGRSATWQHVLCNTARGATKFLQSNAVDTETTAATSLTSFNSDGFSLGAYVVTNTNNNTYASWSFRKAKKFFTVVEYTGNGGALNVSHDLGSTPGAIFIKARDDTDDWYVWHRGLASATQSWLKLNATDATATSSTIWNDTAPTSTQFSVGNAGATSKNNVNYVAYLWAHDAGGFGDDGLQNVVSCGSYTGNGGTQDINVGFEPQWVLIKNIDNPGPWALFDNMRSFIVDNSADSLSLRLNTTAAEGSATNARIGPRPNGFGFINEGGGDINSGAAYTYIYIAIRRGPMKTPEAGTEVFGLSARSGTGANATVTGSAGVSDAVLVKNRGSAVASLFAARLTATNYLVTSTTAAQVAAATTILQANPWDVMDGVKVGTTSTITNASGNTFINYLFSRAPGFFDVVCYTGTGANRTVAHNLGVAPELMLVKRRSAADAWAVYFGDPTDYLRLNEDQGAVDDIGRWNDTSPTSTVFTVGTDTEVNTSAVTYVAYLFASLAGVSDIGTYTGNGSSVTVTTGFQPRFILVKRTDSNGNWIVGDSSRGLPAGDDPFFLLNTDAAETTNQDWVDVSATGFTVNETAANANVSTATYIYLCVA